MDPYTPNPANDPLTINVPDDVLDNWTATVINTPTKSAADSIAYLRQRAGWLSSANFNRTLGAWTGTQVSGGVSSMVMKTPPVWDAAYARWLAGFFDSPGSSPLAEVLQSEDGWTWYPQQAGSNSAGGTDGCIGIIVRATDGVTVNFGHPSGYESRIFTPATGSLSVNPVTWFTAPGAGHWISGAFFNSLWVAWVGGSSSVSPHYSSDGLTWTAAATWSPPSGFTIHDRAHFTGTVSSTTAAFIFPAGTSSVTKFMVSNDGQNWNPFSMPTLGAGESVVDACLDSLTGTIYLLTGTGSVSHLWSTPLAGSLTVWTAVATLNHQSFGMRANGRELLIWLQLGQYFSNGSASLQPLYRGIVTVDGGVTFRAVGASSTTVPGNFFALRSNGGQFLYINTTEYAPSIASSLAPPLAV